VQQAARSGVALPWSDHDPDHVPIRGSHYQRRVAKRLNVATPTNVYPFYENATLAAWGQSPQEAQAESAALWSRMSTARLAASRLSFFCRSPLLRGIIEGATTMHSSPSLVRVR
jgi:acetyl-CoA C-acetyltransferase